MVFRKSGEITENEIVKKVLAINILLGIQFLIGAGNKIEEIGKLSLPDFLLIGPSKSGTTSLYNYITQHPQILRASKKEVRYFDKLANFSKGVFWYSSHFPKKMDGQITGEASPSYLFHPLAYKRIHSLLPKAKFIIILRNPIDRTYSAYQMYKRLGRLSCSFEEFLESCPTNCENYVYTSEDLAGNSNDSAVLCRGIYIHQIQRWFSVLSPDQFLILSFEEFKEPQKMMDKVFEFLGVASFDDIKFEKLNSGGSYLPMAPETRMYLKKFFDPYNTMLEEFLERRFNWK